MSNINRDYLVVIDVKSGTMNKPSMVFYNTDKNTSNIYAQLVIKETIVHATPIENATNYSVELKVVKPGNIIKMMTGVLVNEAEAIYEFDLPVDFINLDGTYAIEFWVKAIVADREEVITSSRGKYTVKASILTDLDEAIEDHEDYPLFLKLMEEVKVINETAHELDTTIRTLQADMIDANNEMKTNEEQRKANEVLRETNEEQRKEAERTRANQEVAREQAEATRESNEQQRIANENDRIYKEDRRESQERDRVSNEYDRQNAEQSREYAEIDRVANEETRQTNEANREVAEQIRRTNEEARITAETARVTEHEQMRTELNEVKAENAVLMENDKKQADRMTQVEISDKRQYVIMEGLMNSAGDGYLKIEDTGNDTTLYNSVEGFVDVKNITGNTMVNSIKNPDDEFTLNGDINTSGQSVTLTTAVDNGQVDVLAEGNTMVNVCDQQEPVAITKSYTVETGNHVALQGEYDGKARPVVQGNTLVNLASEITNGGLVDKSQYLAVELKINLLANKDYTFILDMTRNSGTGKLRVRESKADGSGANYQSVLMFDSDAKYQFVKFTPEYEYMRIVFYTDDEGDSYTINNFMILEGDYTNKPIPDYFTGMQSSFEDKVVTQEMVDSGEELAENLGKYKVEYKVTGKNKASSQNTNNFYYDSPWGNGNDVVKLVYSDNAHTSDLIKVLPNTTYTYNCTNKNRAQVHFFKNENDELPYGGVGFPQVDVSIPNTFTTDNECNYIRLYLGGFTDVSDIQIEEGSTATAYEPYKESIKTYYLNSPLLEGDTIEESNGNVVHVHRYRKKVLDGSKIYSLAPNSQDANSIPFFIINFGEAKSILICDRLIVRKDTNDDKISNSTTNLGVMLDGNKLLRIKTGATTLDEFNTWISNNPLTVVYELASPTYEAISRNDSILTDSYVAGHLDFDTAVPVEQVKFKEAYVPYKYLYPNTNYTIQFESDNIGKIDNLFMESGLDNLDIVKGINKFNITTPANILYTSMAIKGIGFNASNIVVTEATDKDFGYFSGMKSVGELEENKIEILSRNKNCFIINEDTSWSGNGIDIKFNKNNQCIEINGTVTSDSYFYAHTYKYSVEGIKEGTASIISANITGDYNTDNCVDTSECFYLYICSTLMGKFSSTSKTFTNTIDNSTYRKESMWIRFRRGAVYNNCKIYIQVEEGSTSTAYIPHTENKKQILLNEPLRAVGDTKDRFVQIDGKWYVERNCYQRILNGSENWLTINNNYARYIYSPKGKLVNNKVSMICDKIKTVESLRDEEGIMANDAFRIRIGETMTGEQAKAYLQANPITVTYVLASPTYEPVEIAPTVNTYTDVTHITNNSTIPMNMPIVNSGYEIIAKPSTKYTVVGIDNGRIGDSTIVNGTITTPATITDNFLRPYGTGKTSKVMLLEGEPANIPSYFKGIKSVFEDKVTEDGKYAVEVKVVGKNKFDGKWEYGSINQDTGYHNESAVNIRSVNYIPVKSNMTYIASSSVLTGSKVVFVFFDSNYKYIGASTNSSTITTPNNTKYIKVRTFNNDSNVISLTCPLQIEEGTVATEYEPYHETKQTLYLDEPLYNTNNITIYNDKLGYWKNWDKIVLDGSEDWTKDVFENIEKQIKTYRCRINFNTIKFNSYVLCDNFNSILYDGYDTEAIEVGGSPHLFLGINRAKLSTQDVSGFKQYLSQNPVTVVYQLAEPVFVPVIDNCPNFVIGSWDNCSIHFDSIIPLKDTRYRYTGNVPSVVAMSDDVAEAKSISDQQDSMIIDLATDVAVMEMMLM